MKLNLDLTHVLGTDLSEQPNSRYVLVLGEPGSVRYFAFDKYKDRNFLIEFYRDGESEPIAVFRMETQVPWAVYRRDTVEVVDTAELVRQHARNTTANRAFQKTLVAEGLIEAEDSVTVDGTKVAPEDDRWARAAYR